MTIAVFATPFKSSKIASQAFGFINQAAEMDDKVIIACSTKKALDDKGYDLNGDSRFIITDSPRVPANTDLIVSLGGDGTFLRAARWSAETQTPIVGVNLGHLGYLPSFNLDELPQVLGLLKDGDYDMEERELLKIELPENISSSVSDFWPYALNEVAILKQDTASMISVPVEIDGRELSIYRADGLIIATPTGSTGYNLSVGGPILQPTIPAWVLSPIADHSLTMRPMVISDNSRLVVTASGRAEAFRVSIDGISFTLPGGTPLTITKAPVKCRIIVRKGRSFAATLRSKLLWGESLMIG